MKKGVLFHQSLLQNLKNLFSNIGVTVGLDIGSSSIKIVELKKAKGGFTLSNFIFTVIPPAIRSNQTELTQFIIDTIKGAIREGKITALGVFLVLSGREVKLLSLTLPKVAKRDLKGTILLEIKKQIPFNPQEAFFDFQVSSEIPDRAGPKLQVIAAVANKQAVEERIKILRKTGLRPLGINIVPNVLGNILEKAAEGSAEEVIALLDMGARLSTLCIFKAGNLEFSREIVTAGDHLTQGLVRKITLPDREINITLEEAEKIKRQCGIPRKEELEEKIGVLTKSHVLAMFRPTLERLASEILRSINYYRQRFKIAKIDRLLLSGGGSRLKNIEQFLSLGLKETKIGKLDPLTIITGWTDPAVAQQDPLEELAPHLSVAFGLVLGRKKAGIELLPFEVRLQEKFALVKFVLKVTVPIIIGVLFLLYAVLSAQSSHYRRLLGQAQMTLESFEPTKELIQEYDFLKQKMEQRKNLLEKAVGRQPLWWGILKELGQIGPEGVTLDRLAAIKGSRPLELRLKGEIVPSYTTIDLALSQYLLALEESPFFENVELVSQTRDIYSPTPKAKFELTLKLVY